MSTTTLHSRASATVLSLSLSMALAASPLAFAQTPWDAQDQYDMWGRLQAQGLVRSPVAIRVEAVNRGERAAPGLHDAGRDDAAGAHPRRRSGPGVAPEASPTPNVAAPSDTAIDAATLSAPAQVEALLGCNTEV